MTQINDIELTSDEYTSTVLRELFSIRQRAAVRALVNLAAERAQAVSSTNTNFKVATESADREYKQITDEIKSNYETEMQEIESEYRESTTQIETRYSTDLGNTQSQRTSTFRKISEEAVEETLGGGD